VAQPDVAATGSLPRTVLHLITTLTQGGAERVMSEVVPSPDRDVTARHVVVSLARGGMFAELLASRGVEVRSLDMRPGRDLLRGVRRMRALERELAPDLVVSWMYHACLVAMLASPLRRRHSVPEQVWFLQGSLHNLDGLPWHTRAIVRLLARCSRRADAIAINSREGLAHHARLGYRPHRWMVLPNGCDTTTFRPDATDRAVVREELGVPSDAVLLVSVARVHPQKDHPTLLAAVREAQRVDPRIQLLMIGTGTDALLSELSDVQRGGTGSRVLGIGPRPDVARLLRGCDVLVSSSTSEGLPNALLEGMASGLPSVVTDVGDCRAVVGDTGRVVPPSDVSALATAIVDLAGLPAAEREGLGQRARHRVECHHDIARARREYRALWDAHTALEVGRTRPMRVVHVIARMNVGGPAQILAALLDHMDTERFEQWLVVGSVGRGEEDWFELRAPELLADPRIIRVPTFGRSIDPLRDVRSLRSLTATLRELAPDVVNTHTAKAGLLGRIAARRAGVPRVVHTFHGHTLHGYFSAPVTALFVRIERWLAPRTDRLVAVGARVRDELVAAGIGHPTDYTLIPPGVADTGVVPSDMARRALGLEVGAPVVTFVGRLTDVKRPDRFLAMAERVSAVRPGTVFLVAGDGEQRTSLEARPRHADVRFLGWRGDVRTLYAASDVVVVTSDNEGMPVTLIEAAMAGRACVTTGVGSAAEVVADGITGCVVPADDAELATAVLALLADDGSRDRMAAAARERALQHFSSDALIAQSVVLYEGLRR
jgi:glycosyltransferase involved in cell wall biosynthesis